MLLIDQGGDVAEPAFRIFRLVFRLSIVLAAVAACRWGIRTFLLNPGPRSDRWRNTYSAINALVLLVLILSRGPADKLLTVIGDSISRLGPPGELVWLTPSIVGLYYALIASSMLFLASHLGGLGYRFAESLVDAWQSRLRAVGVIESNPRFHASHIFQMSIHVLRNLLATALVVVYFLYGFAVFPRTRIFTVDLLTALGPPFRDAMKAVDDYLPNLGYLCVILLLAWLLLKTLKYFFAAVQRGTIVFENFPTYWAEPTYKLIRTILFLFVLMVSFPYLPGAKSTFFRGFTVFLGALVTFGSSGVIGNLLAGILLTYARAFRVGDVVRIEDVYGKVAEKTLLVTRLITAGHEHVTIPNSKVLADSVTNYSAHRLTEGFALGITATIGYDVDWRTVHTLLLDGAHRTEQIATEPAPEAVENSFGNYSVEYELRVWTKTSDDIFETCAALRRNVLDAFADAGVEIMTPTILSHRDASGLAVPAARFPNRSQPQGIRITVDPK